MAKKQKSIKQPIQKGVAKVPVIMQMEALECGAAALDMILAYYDKWIPLEQVRGDCGVSRDGSNARNILKAARGYGLIAKGYRYELDELMKKATFPCIIHWNFNHFIVLDGFKHGKAYINDPGNGNYAISMDEFDRGFTGICLKFEPGEEFVPSGKKKSMLGYAKERLAGAGAAVAFLSIAMVIASVLAILNPVFSRIFVDRILTNQNPDWFIPFIIALSCLSFIQIVIAWIQAVFSLRIKGKLSIIGSTSLVWRMLRLPMEFFSQRLAGDLQERDNSNATIATALVETVAPLVINSVMLLFYLVVMVRYSWILSLIGVSSVIINMLVSRVISNKRINITRVQMRDRGKLAGMTVSGIGMIETIKSSGAENGFFEKWSGCQAVVNTQKVKYTKLNTYLGIIPGLVSSLTGVLILVIGVYLIIKDDMSIGMLMAFQGFMASFMAPANSLIEASQTIQEMRTEMERVQDVMNYPLDKEWDEKPVDRNSDYNKLTGLVELKNVTFGYSKLAEPIIKDFSLTIRPGSRVALVGASGCGKSTISKLISGLYSPWEGEILYDGKKINEINRNVFTGSLAVVDQDIIIFEDTIANNIKMWDDSIEDFEMIMAARDAKLHEDIMQRDGGYQYVLTEGGKDLSGGQRQRLEIARVLAIDPTFIILDEATSALDSRTENEVVKSIKDRGITCLIVAHRLSTIVGCDEIIVMDKGEIVERGTHKELMKKNGLYESLISNE